MGRCCWEKIAWVEAAVIGWVEMIVGAEVVYAAVVVMGTLAQRQDPGWPGKAPASQMATHPPQTHLDARYC